MNKIICDNCKEEIKPVIEFKHLTNGVRLNYFRCNSCKEKFLIDVTDQTTRDKQQALARKQKYQSGIAEYIDRNSLTPYSLSALQQEMADNTETMEQMLKEIKEAKKVLREKYEGEL